MAANRGKQFESAFREDWKRSFPDTFLLRLSDQMSGFYGSKNICDFIAFNNATLYLIECKACGGASIPFTSLTQYNSLTAYTSYDGVRAGFMVWLYDKDVILYVPVSTVTEMKKQGKKSVGLSAIGSFNIKVVPTDKRRVFLTANYEFMKDLEEFE